MAIYADKKAGKLTGWYRVEVNLPGGGRLRARCKDHSEAVAKEREFKLTRVAKPTTDDKGVVRETLLAKLKELGPKLWKEHKTAKRSQVLVETAIILAGDVYLDEVNVDWVDKVVTALEERELKGSTINRYLAPLHKFLRRLAKRKLIPELPDFEDHWQEEKESRVRWLTDEEEAKLLSLVRPNVAAFIKLAILSGCRRGELMAIPTGQVQVDDLGIHIPPEVAKSGKGRLVRVKAKARACIATLNDLGWPTRSILAQDWQKARETMKLDKDPYFVFHVCRHTCATRMLRSRVQLPTVRDWLGHADIETTLIYAHVIPEDMEDAAEAMEKWGEVKVTPPATPLPHQHAA